MRQLSDNQIADTVDQVPDELLSHIFLLGIRSEYSDEESVGDDGDDDRNGGSEVLDFRRLVSHVCPRWRCVAIGMAAL